MLKVKTGDTDKLGLLYERNKGLIFGYLYNMNRDAMLAEDLLHTVFIRVLKYRNNFRGDGKFSTWLFHIARNVNADYHRKNKHAAEMIRLDHTPIPPLYENDDSASEELAHSRLDQALQLLDAEKREVIVMTKLKKMKYKEVSEILNCSEGAIKSKVFRAMQSLKEKYTQVESLMI
jgi:RNA polymerase sigma factor (sigma-70 family)